MLTPFDDFDPIEFSSIQLQNLVIAKMGDRRGVGVLEQIALGPHRCYPGWTGTPRLRAAAASASSNVARLTR